MNPLRLGGSPSDGKELAARFRQGDRQRMYPSLYRSSSHCLCHPFSGCDSRTTEFLSASLSLSLSQLITASLLHNTMDGSCRLMLLICVCMSPFF